MTSDTGALRRLAQIPLRVGTRAPLPMIGPLILMINTGPSPALTVLPLLLITRPRILILDGCTSSASRPKPTGPGVCPRLLRRG